MLLIERGLGSYSGERGSWRDNHACRRFWARLQTLTRGPHFGLGRGGAGGRQGLAGCLQIGAGRGRLNAKGWY